MDWFIKWINTSSSVAAGTTCKVEPAATGLEDVFIHLMNQSTDNYGPRK